MKTKDIISLGVIVVAIGGAVVMGYLALQRSAGGKPSTDNGPQVSIVLPQGRALEFETIEDFNKNKVMFPYPQVSPVEIGVSPSLLVK